MGHLPGQDYKGTIENGRYYHCQNCGFLVDTMKFSEGDGSGMNITMATNPAEVYNFDSRIYFDMFDHFGTVETDFSPDGSVRNVQHEIALTVSGGCPLCGCKAYKGA